MIKNKVFIYTLECPISNEVRYVGKTINLLDRLRGHIKTSKKLKTHKDKWVNSLINEGLKPIIKELDCVDEDNWQYWEKHYIQLFKNQGFNLVNHTEGGDGGSFNKHSEESKKKMSEFRTGKKRSEFTDEWRKNLSESAKIKIFTKEHRENISKSLKGRVLKPRNEEWCKNISESKKNTIVSEEVKQLKRKNSPLRKSIICLDTNIIYHSISDASRKLGIPISSIGGVLKQRRKLAKGLKFEYYE
jgi:group I intron endonuclease